MRVTKCDICNKVITNSQKRVTAGFGWDSNEFCMDCGKPVIKFLLSNTFIDKNKLSD